MAVMIAISAFLLLTLRTSAAVVAATLPRSNTDSGAVTCKCVPGEACWPSVSAWSTFNASVDGNLIATKPLGAPCHDQAFGPYDAAKCQTIRDEYFMAEAHMSSSSSVMQPYFTNSCNPFTSRSEACTLGNYVAYAVAARTADHVAKTVRFAKKYGIRFVIKNTGHDYSAKSTGASALSVWTRHLRSKEYHPSYQSEGYQGKAVRLGAGVLSIEALQFADANNIVVVTGNCPTTGLVGGYTQGGGHGRLSSRYGLAADQVLSWDVVTANGTMVTAKPNSPSADLFWALNGGGGGTYAVVLSMTVKAYEPTPVSAANLTFSLTPTNSDAFFHVLGIFQSSLPAMVDRGIVAHWLVTPQFFLLSPLTAPGVPRADLDALMKPTLDALAGYTQDVVPHQYASFQYGSVLEAYNAMPVAPSTVADLHIGSRLLPRTAIVQRNAAVIAAVKQVLANGLIMSGIGLNVSRHVPYPSAVAANPYWRETMVQMAVGCFINFTDWAQNEVCRSSISRTLRESVASINPQGGAYLNEADYRQPDWQSLFYGSHYPALLRVKAKYDPQDLFYGITSVGSEKWMQRADGRLCRV